MQPYDRDKTEDSPSKTRLLHSDIGREISTSTSSVTKDRNKRILVVDDDPDVTYSIKIGLEYDDSTIMADCFSNPVDAFLQFTPGFYDLLLVDVNMPVMSGFELAEKILQKDTNIRICFMTAGEVNVDAVREVHTLRSIGCFITKPITTYALVKRIRAELE